MQPEAIVQAVKDIYAKNAFMQHCGIKIHSIRCGKAAVGLRIDPAVHTNLNGRLHGGLLMTLVDNATGIACAAMGKRVVTVSLTVDFIKGAPAGDAVEAQAEVVSKDGGLITMHLAVYDTDTGKLLATGICTMMAIADFPGIPEAW